MLNENLKCDAHGCDHVEEVEVITEDMVGMPCPECGSSLLTAEDWKNWQVVRELMVAVGAAASDIDPHQEKISVRIGLHGQKTTLEIEPTKEKIMTK